MALSAVIVAISTATNGLRNELLATMESNSTVVETALDKEFDLVRSAAETQKTITESEFTAADQQVREDYTAQTERIKKIEVAVEDHDLQMHGQNENMMRYEAQQKRTRSSRD